MRTFLLAVVGLSAIGCGSSASTPGAAPTAGMQCAQRVGTFVTDFSERAGGTCGALPEQVDSVTEQPKAVASPCTGTLSYSADNCRVTLDQKCPGAGGLVVELRGEIDWSADGTHGSGLFQAIGTKPGTSGCSSTYDTTDTKR